MNPMRIGFSYAKGIMGMFSRIIMLFTGAKASHAWMLYWDVDFEMDMVMDAHETGIRIVPLTKFMQKNNVIEIYTPSISIDSGLKAAGQWIGTPYDYEGLFGMMWVQIGRWFKRKWKNPFATTKMVFCSKWCLLTMQAAKYPGSISFDPDGTNPWDLRGVLAGDGSKLWVVPT